MGALDYEIGWDDEIVKDEPEFVLLEEGDYNFTVSHFERARHEPKPGGKIPACNKAIVYFDVQGNDGETLQLKVDYLMWGTMEWKLGELFAGLGMKKKGEKLKLNWTAIPGKTGRCHVVQKPGKEAGKVFNNISKIYPKDEAPASYQAGVF